MVTREESSGRIKSGQQDPVQANGYFHLYMTGDASCLQHGSDRTLHIVGRSRLMFGRFPLMRGHSSHYGLVGFTGMFAH
ncbi:hypothetical protein TIFTF001_017300 [Ficus carica]|uniref:Uncharacterized protein n=1 Tax=Ficus carica TaxID=3494 RepID=A0AA88A4Q7_FICCA|nr:hypothetical protein TIFTF001_017300 [Ficus carica]